MIEGFHPAIRAWFQETFEAPSSPQAMGWPPIREGRHTLIQAPTGSGKTLAAFLECLNQLLLTGEAEASDGVRILYVSPLRALNNDIQRNLAVPLAGIERAAARLGTPLPEIRTAVRTGDTPARERQSMLRRPPHVLITTPESLYLLLTGARSAAILRRVRYVIVDEIHALAAEKRGVHLAVSLERLVEEAGEFQRIGLSATQRPIEEIARFLGGSAGEGWRPVTIVDAAQERAMDLQLCCPAPFYPAAGSVWPAIHRRLLEWIGAHRTTIVFVNSRGLAERLTSRLNELAWTEGIVPAGVPWVEAHHGSLSRDQREAVEEKLKAGALAGIVATASLELGIDVGAVDLVVQIGSPRSAARGLQRVGRSGHVLHATSRGRIVPLHAEDLLEAAVVAAEMQRGEIEATKIPQGCLDVLAQHVVAMVARRPWRIPDLLAVLRRAYPYRELTRDELIRVVRMLAGQYGGALHSPGPVPVRARLFFDEANEEMRPHPSARFVATASGGTIPDRGHYTVQVTGNGGRPFALGELDEEFVFESRVGDAFRLGNGVWRIEAIEPDRVLASPAPGMVARLPFWKGEGIGRPY
ncbi:MAG TPA: DEAD/DEAH box helicase, partial [Limnochordia bacterium]